MRNYSFKVLRVGQLRTNKFLYPNEQRVTICTTTLIQDDHLNLIIDPGWHNDELMDALHAANVSANEIGLIYLTHLHADHIRSIRLFPNTPWLAPKQEIENWVHKIPDEDKDILEKLQPIENQIADDIRIVGTPGHTMGHTSVLFHHNGERIVVAADAVLTKEYYEHREVHVNSEDKALAVSSIELVKNMADLIIPGHDEPFRPF